MKLRLTGISRHATLERQIALLKNEISGALDISNAIRHGKKFDNTIEGQFDAPLTKTLAELWKFHSEINDREDVYKWANEGVLGLTEIFKSSSAQFDSNLDTALSYLVRHIGANQAALFVLNDDDAETPFLELKSAYAYGKKKHITVSIEPGSGLIGECFLEGMPIHLKKVPSDYVKITSGLGEATPSSLILVPLVLHDKKVGVIEMAYFKSLEQSEIQFLERAANTFASYVIEIREKERMRRLLVAAENATARLQESEAVSQRHMKELQDMQEKMAMQNELLERSNQSLELKQVELQQMKEQEAEMLESKLKANEAIHEAIISRLKKRVQELMEENQYHSTIK